MTALPGEGDYPILYREHRLPSGRRLPAYISRPDLAGSYPTVLVAHPAYGLTSHVKAVCRHLGRHGFAAICPDLYRGEGPVRQISREEARTAFSAVPDRRAFADLEEAYDFAARPGTEWAGADSVGLLGLGAGGRIALLAAARRPEVAAVAVAYAPLDEGNDEEHMSVLEAVSQIEVPILGLYCHDDGVVPVERVHQARGRAKGGEWIIYHDTGHDFMDEGRAEYNAPSAADALSRIVGFLSEHLPAPVGVT